MSDRKSRPSATPILRALAWLAGLLLLAVAAVWPGFADQLAQLLYVAAAFLMLGAAHLLAHPPILALAALGVAVARHSRRRAAP
ncbi:hypothetical protein LXH13_06250 [Streptomyces spinosirectus]|jgi:hypothetical protein|uniref:hypothetical protein n=1 Tax=Streptomyces TaxID=1883 RepID=UPI001C9DEE02|nr:MULTISPECIES: hypothetical protein [Streptomyces]MBY8341991.1 hypothetical protein [Streptomyces plumbidurans]UIR16660.1 hypothetical protein LXH13_06250 [Streptomyces spinosirectus]